MGSTFHPMEEFLPASIEDSCGNVAGILVQLARLLARQAAREAFAEITAGKSINRLPKFQSEKGND